MIRCVTGYIKMTYLFHYAQKQKLIIRELKRWRKAFLHLLCNIQKNDSDYMECWKVLEGFTRSNIKIVKKVKGGKNVKDPILICVVLNEIERMKVFLEHYRKIGIKKFAILDNGSTDGTLRYLKSQPDVELFQTKDKFQTHIKMGWINRLISYYGTGHWYLVVDADELLVWQGVEEGTIQDVIEHVKGKDISRARALMIDMYPKEITWDTNASFEQILPKCRYFDCDTYYHRKNNEIYLLCGGPRKRMLGKDLWLTKYPLFHLEENEIMINPHAIYPYNSTKTPCYLALLHYKFLTQNDQKKIRLYARNGNYACGSMEYKVYLKKQKEDRANFQFYHEKSTEYQSSQSLAKIRELNRM